VAQHVAAVHLKEGANELTVDRVLARRVAVGGRGVVRTEGDAGQGHGSRRVSVKDRPPHLEPWDVRSAGIECLIPHDAVVAVRAADIEGDGRTTGWDEVGAH